MKNTTPSRYIFGATRINDPESPIHLELVQKALDREFWFHTAYDYPGVPVLKKVFEQNPGHKPKCIFKVKAHDPITLRRQVLKSLEVTGLKSADIVQICENPPAHFFLPNHPFCQEMTALKNEGVVKACAPEIYWQYSENFYKVFKGDWKTHFCGVFFYYNLVERDVTNDFYDLIVKQRVPIFALRALGGGIGNFSDTPKKLAIQQHLESAFQVSGCQTRQEFRIRFLLSLPEVISFVGGVSQTSHLEFYEEIVESRGMLNPDLVLNITDHHRDWWRRSGIGAGTFMPHWSKRLFVNLPKKILRKIGWLLGRN